jgi:predicted tellurium resistance membrane protein TerC
MDFLHTLLGDDIKAGLLIILNLIVIESLLSVDNAAVLATMVIDLPREQRSRALRYGIIGAYAMRGVCLFLAAWLVQIWWLGRGPCHQSNPGYPTGALSSFRTL